jgi:hypothetical protein
MSKFVVVLFALAFVTMSVISQASNPRSAQTRCNLTDATAPSVRGLRLGMTTQQLLAVFPGITKKKEMKDAIEKAKSATGVEAMYLGFDPATDGDAQQFAGVVSVSAGLYRARVVDFSVQYVGATWTVDSWIATLSEAFKLPSAQDWVLGPDEAPNKVLKCDGILIEAAIQGGSASIRIRNTEYLKETEERTKAADEKKRQEIKP